MINLENQYKTHITFKKKIFIVIDDTSDNVNKNKMKKI